MGTTYLIRRADPNLTRTYKWDYSLGIQRELLPRVAVFGSWYHSVFYDLTATRNSLLTLSDYTPFSDRQPHW
jgi:hypothetical protein